jgi:hypothetical protein
MIEHGLSFLQRNGDKFGLTWPGPLQQALEQADGFGASELEEVRFSHSS